ncbi:hypothetical protein ACHAXT_007258 [Thalassiosira profunda]
MKLSRAAKRTARMDDPASSSLTSNGADSAVGPLNSSSPASAATAASTKSDSRTPSTGSPPATIDADEQRRQDRRVCIVRGATIAVLVAAAATVAALTAWYVKQDEQSNFELQYRDSVAKVAEAFQHRIDTKHEVAKTFSAMITSRYGDVAQAAVGKPPLWPNVTIPDFQEQAEGSLAIADGRALSFNPIITQDVNRLQFEAHASESAHMLGLQDDDQFILDPSVNRTVSFGIYSRDSEGNIVYDPGYAPESTHPHVMVPVWQIAPIETNEKAVMFNLHWERNRQRALDHMIDYGVPDLTAILQLVQDAELRPSSILFYPVFDVFGRWDTFEAGERRGLQGNEDTGEEETGEEDTVANAGEDTEATTETVGETQQHVTGSVSIVFSWDTLLNKILPDYIRGMFCILQSSTGQKFTYSISGDSVTLLGEGDLHDPAYDEYGEHVQATLLLEGEDKFVTYQLHMYPSAEFEAQYVTNRAGIYAAGAVLIFVFTAGLFLLYDYLVEDRQQKMARRAQQTGNIVDSMFPAAFRERLFRAHGDSQHPQATRRRSSNIASVAGDSVLGSHNSEAAKSHTSHGTDDTEKGSGVAKRGSVLVQKASALTSKQGALKQIDRFMKGVRSSDTDGQHNPLAPPMDGVDDEPIADLFQQTSILFADIVEQIFWEFDELAARHQVFKLGTIGDCYIAVTGIPDPVEDHATVLTLFAFEARERVREVCARLDREGLDTSRLDMRFGIHSGATTAGILRGTKSRFELFGDTINTASRMESTGLGGKIQVSEETAALIRQDGKARWLVRREALVTAKGKGDLQTYWAEPQRASVRFSEKISRYFMDGSLRESSNDNVNHALDELEDTLRTSNREGDELDLEGGLAVGNGTNVAQAIPVSEKGMDNGARSSPLSESSSILEAVDEGFTNWSATKSPHDVFRLLEQIFWEFNELAARHQVFKLGTIGDCYIAVTGIPDPVEDHATVLTLFAFEARERVREVCARLDREGLDTSRLDMRFGIHSGATTAGILRGTKSRFELFGDTINTASRMESTGLGGKIQVSEETAALIRQDGKARWLVRREALVTAKGKGDLQTYWAEPQRASVRFSEKISRYFMDGSLRESSNDNVNHALDELEDTLRTSNREGDELDLEGGLAVGNGTNVAQAIPVSEKGMDNGARSSPLSESSSILEAVDEGAAVEMAKNATPSDENV